MNTVIIILFLACVLGISISPIVSPTAQTYLRDRNPRIQNCNFVLLGFAVLLANFVRLPLTITHPFGVWAINLGICLFLGLFLFVVVLIIGVFYKYWRKETCF
ncbi:MAG: hypothetical protein IKN71_08400 [Alphaproteobacteria bacterium]|jgi:uncharacterized membrane protein|nr:hypothetical protein [Alphaproteobacteria bacterium]